jgi:hypothetical protein
LASENEKEWVGRRTICGACDARPFPFITERTHRTGRLKFTTMKNLIPQEDFSTMDIRASLSGALVVAANPSNRSYTNRFFIPSLQ